MTGPKGPPIPVAGLAAAAPEVPLEACCASSADHNLAVTQILLHKFECIHKSCQNYDRSAMLVIMKYWNVQEFTKASLDFKAARCRNIL